MAADPDCINIFETIFRVRADLEIHQHRMFTLVREMHEMVCQTRDMVSESRELLKRTEDSGAVGSCLDGEVPHPPGIGGAPIRTPPPSRVRSRPQSGH